MLLCVPQIRVMSVGVFLSAVGLTTATIAPQTAPTPSAASSAPAGLEWPLTPSLVLVSACLLVDYALEHTYIRIYVAPPRPDPPRSVSITIVGTTTITISWLAPLGT